MDGEVTFAALFFIGCLGAIIYLRKRRRSLAAHQGHMTRSARAIARAYEEDARAGRGGGGGGGGASVQVNVRVDNRKQKTKTGR